MEISHTIEKETAMGFTIVMTIMVLKICTVVALVAFHADLFNAHHTKHERIHEKSGLLDKNN